MVPDIHISKFTLSTLNAVEPSLFFFLQLQGLVSIYIRTVEQVFMF